MIIHVFKNHYHEFSLQRLFYNNWRLPNLYSHLAHFDSLTQNVSAPNSQGAIMPAVLDLLFLRHY